MPKKIRFDIIETIIRLKGMQFCLITYNYNILIDFDFDY